MTSQSTMDNNVDSFEINSTNVTVDLSAHEGNTQDLKHNEYTPDLIIPLTVVYVTVLIAGVLGNLTTCLVIAKNKVMRTVSNFYLINLAFSNLVLLLCGLPFELDKLWNPSTYPLDESLCIVFSLTAEMAANTSILTITALIVERYIEICHKHESRNKSDLSRVMNVEIAIWIIALLTAVPLARQFGIVSYVENRHMVTSCTVKDFGFHKIFLLSSIAYFVTPMGAVTVLFMLICIKLRRSRQLHQVNRTSIEFSNRDRQALYRSPTSQTGVLGMLFVAISFFIGWAPFHIQRLLAVYGIRMKQTSNNFYLAYVMLTHLSGISFYISAAINPTLYNFMTKKFRYAFKRTLESWCEEQPPQCQTYNIMLALQREQFNTIEAKRARARRLRAFRTIEIHDAPPRAESSSSRGCQYGHNELSDSVGSQASISNTSLRDVDMKLGGDLLTTY